MRIALITVFLMVCVFTRYAMAGDMSDGERYDAIKAAIELAAGASNQPEAQRHTLIDLMRSSVADLVKLEQQFGVIEPVMAK